MGLEYDDRAKTFRGTPDRGRAKLSSTKLSPCMCGRTPYGPVDIGLSKRLFLRCEPCGYMTGDYSKGAARKLWNAAMLGLSMEDKEK